MTQDTLELAGIFDAVTKTLVANQGSLNQADSYNQDHGDNMVQTFQTITDALQKKKSVSTSKALSYAANVLSKKTSSSSGRLYAQNLSRAATQFKGQSFDATGAISLLQTLIGGGQANQATSQSSGGDMLSALLGNMTPTENAPVQQASQSGGGDVVGMLLGSLLGGTGAQAPAQSSSGDLLSSLLGGVLGGGSGGGLGNLVQSLLGGSGMGDASHRKDSTQMVISAFLQALTALKK